MTSKNLPSVKRIASLCLLILLSSTLFAQEVQELPFKPLEKEFVTLANKLVEIDKTNDQKSVDLSLKALNKFTDEHVRYDLIFWELSFHYANLKQYDKCLEILRMGQDEGMYYSLFDTKQPFPEYLKEIKKLEAYPAFMEKNKQLQEENKKGASMNYMLMLPEKYDTNNRYPLLLISHGGIGSIPDMQYFYDSPKLRSEFVVAYFHGSIPLGSFTRSFNREGYKERFQQAYKQIVENYAVDTTKVILGGPSAGGYRAIELGLEKTLPAKGLLLSFAVAPKDIGDALYQEAAERGMKVALLCGEYDWAVKQQKELAYKLDQNEIKNRFVVFPEIGHEYPKNWPHHMDTSLEFLLADD